VSRRSIGQFMVLIATPVMLVWFVAGIIGCWRHLDGIFRFVGLIPGTAIGLTRWDRTSSGGPNWIWVGIFLATVVWIIVAERIPTDPSQATPDTEASARSRSLRCARAVMPSARAEPSAARRWP
jgi:hypothetical protein